MYYFFYLYVTFFSECWCNRLLKCISFTYQQIFFGQRYTLKFIIVVYERQIMTQIRYNGQYWQRFASISFSFKGDDSFGGGGHFHLKLYYVREIRPQKSNQTNTNSIIMSAEDCQVWWIWLTMLKLVDHLPIGMENDKIHCDISTFQLLQVEDRGSKDKLEQNQFEKIGKTHNIWRMRYNCSFFCATFFWVYSSAFVLSTHYSIGVRGGELRKGLCT